MSAAIFQCSEQAAALIDPTTERTLDTQVETKSKYFFAQLQVGQSFAVPFANVGSEQGFRVTVSRNGKRLAKRFAVVKHDSLQLYEVARIK